MAPFRSSLHPGAGVLLAVAWFVSPAWASAELEGAKAAAPVSCVAAQFALRAYVIALQSGDAATAARDPALIVQAITPSCRDAIQGGRWPGLAAELLNQASADPQAKPALCAIAPPEAWAAIALWEGASEEARATYDLPCAVALFRHRPEDFTRIVVPRLGGGGGCAFPDLAARLSEALAPDERVALLPTLDFATRTRARGRDRLYQSLCQHPAARTQAVCQAPAALEPTWAHQARIERAIPAIAFHVGLAVLFALAVVLLRHFRGPGWPAVGMSVVATAGTTATVVWIVATKATGDGALNILNDLVAIVAMPVAALLAGLVARAFIRSARGAALPWCLVHAVVYGVITSVHVWAGGMDRLC